jgi:Mrp family chromosome partitioning ATPase
MSLIETAMQRVRDAAGNSARKLPGASQQRKSQTKASPGESIAPIARVYPRCEIDSVAMERYCILPQVADRSALRAYKILRTRLLQRMAANEWHALAITGAGSGQGKTITAINLAITLAQDPNTSVFLVDLDLQRPRVAEYLGIHVGKGLGEYLMGEASIEDIIYSPNIERLAVVPNTQTFEQSSDLLSGQRMLELAQYLKAEQPRRIVIYDMPPLLLSDDVLTFAPNTDGLLMVVSEGTTARGQLEKSKELLAELNLVGVVLNRSMERNDGAYY